MKNKRIAKINKMTESQ